MPGWDAEVPSRPMFGAEAKPPAPEFASSSSVCMGSVLGALAGDAPRGGVVDGGGVLGVALCGSSCCCSPPAYLARSAPKCRAPDTCRRGKSDELTLGSMPGAAPGCSTPPVAPPKYQLGAGHPPRPWPSSLSGPASPRPCKDEDKSRRATQIEEAEITKRNQILTRRPPPPLLFSSSSSG